MTFRYPAIALVLIIFSCTRAPQSGRTATVSGVMDDVISRLYKQVPPERYDSIDDAFMLNFLTDEEKRVLATHYQYFTVNVPVVVSIMRHKEQATVPFWLEPVGFVKTSQTVTSQSYEYEVWQKKFDAGKVELGINGFDKHRPVYFVSVGPQDADDDLQITDVYPAQYEIMTMAPGAFTYHDWSDLLLVDVPPALNGQKLFTTVRGRAREAHVVNAFRKTPYPASGKPDQLMLTWSDTPQTTIDIQWRTDSATTTGAVKFWPAGETATDTATVEASAYLMQDRMLMNDRYIHRFTANLANLRPGTQYFYQAGSPESGMWSDVRTFTTEDDKANGFSFIWFGDTHCFPDSGKLVNLASRHNDAAFYTISGDLVSTGLYRDDWDRFFGHAGKAFSQKPLMPVPGNHDRQDGLGAKMYYDLFSLPKNGPEGVDKESTYAFEYGDALFLMIDATSDVDAHTPWIEEKLKQSKALWKFAMFHFPPYNYEEPYPELQEAWVPLFDRYHVDLVMGGHVHYYMRSRPMNAGKVVDAYDKGTVYTISISIPARHDNMTEEPYAVTQFPVGYYYQHLKIDGKKLYYTSYDQNGKERDAFVIAK